MYSTCPGFDGPAALRILTVSRIAQFDRETLKPVD